MFIFLKQKHIPLAQCPMSAISVGSLELQEPQMSQVKIPAGTKRATIRPPKSKVS